VADLAAVGADDYLFQKVLVSHPEVIGVIGPLVGTIRAMVRLEPDGPRFFGACWRIPSGEHAADSYWRHGNMIGEVDIQTGTVQRVVHGTGPWLEEVRVHPKTEVELVGFTLPDWDAVRELVLHSSRLFPDVGYQAFDIHLSPDGPVIVEQNSGGAPSIPQTAGGKGFLTPDWRAFYARWTHRQMWY
jgi:hypothetical protein